MGMLLHRHMMNLSISEKDSEVIQKEEMEPEVTVEEEEEVFEEKPRRGKPQK